MTSLLPTHLLSHNMSMKVPLHDLLLVVLISPNCRFDEHGKQEQDSTVAAGTNDHEWNTSSRSLRVRGRYLATVFMMTNGDSALREDRVW